MYRFVVAAAASAVLAFGALTPKQKDLNVKSFETVWTTVRDHHWDPKMNGVDWNAAHAEFLPKVERAQSTDEVRQAITAMLDRLHSSHYGIIPAEAYSGIGDGENEGGAGDVGIEVAIADHVPLVRAVAPGSPADRAGVKTGWIISKVRDWDAATSIKKLFESNTAHAELLAWAVTQRRLTADAGEPVNVTFIDGNNTPKSLTLIAGPARGSVTRFGNLPALRVWMDTHRIGDDIEYIHFNQFFDPVRLINQFGNAVTACMQCPGIIIDLRGNTGGIGAMSMGMAGYFVGDSDKKLGTMYLRDTKLNLIINPRPETYSGKVAILVDGSSASTSEFFAGGLQDLKRARIFGTQTAAAALPSSIIRLPNGDGLQYVQANYISEGGKPLEGIGVKPDVEITQSREALLNGHDRVLDAAVDWIKGKQ